MARETAPFFNGSSSYREGGAVVQKVVSLSNEVPPAGITPVPTRVADSETFSEATHSPRVPLPKPDDEKKTSQASGKGVIRTFFSLAGSLVLVLGAFFLVAFLLKKITPSSSGTLPRSVVDAVGQYRLSARHQLYLLKFVDRYLLVSVSGDEITLLTETKDQGEYHTLHQLLEGTNRQINTTSGSDWASTLLRRTGSERENSQR